MRWEKEALKEAVGYAVGNTMPRVAQREKGKKVKGKEKEKVKWVKEGNQEARQGPREDAGSAGATTTPVTARKGRAKERECPLTRYIHHGTESGKRIGVPETPFHHSDAHR